MSSPWTTCTRRVALAGWAVFSLALVGALAACVGADPTAAPPALAPSPSSALETPSPAPVGSIDVVAFDATDGPLMAQVTMEILRLGPGCEGKEMHPTIVDPWSEALERAATAFDGTGRVPSDGPGDLPAVYVGSLQETAQAFGAFKVFALGDADPRYAFLVRLATVEDARVQRELGVPIAVAVRRHDLADARVAWVVTHEVVTLLHCP